MATLPPWLTPARPAPLYATGLGLGLRAAEQQAAIAQRAQAMAAQAAAQQNEALLQAQRMAVQQELAAQEMALKQQQLGLSREELGVNQEELALRQAVEQSKMDEVMAQASAKREYLRRVQQDKEDPITVLMEMGPLMGREGEPMSAAIRYQMEQEKLKSKQGLAQGPVQGQPVMGPDGKPIPGMIAVPSSTGTGYVVHPVRPETPSMTQFQRESLSDRVQRQIDKLYETNSDLAQEVPDPGWTARRLATYKAGRKSLGKLEAKLTALEGEGSPMTTGTTGQAPLPMPKTKAEAVKGQLYQTTMGIMEWNGTKFVKPTTDTETYDER